MNPSWDSKYTTNINMEMNYWAVDSANLSELSEPLFKFIRELTDQGAQVHELLASVAYTCNHDFM